MGLEDKIGNKMQDAKGNAKEHAGRTSGDEDLKNEGRGDQASASAKDGVEKLKDAGQDIKDAFKK